MGEAELVFIDANIFLEFILANEKAEICRDFVEKIRNHEIKAITSDFIIYTCLIQIQYQLKSKQSMHDFIELIHSLNSLHILRPLLNEIDTAIIISEEHKLDFDDSLVVSCMLNNGITKLISLDKDFDKINMIKRLEPEQYLKNN
ncbi:type II toxin-antitoxin system VapC family toxin [Candidatus Woesearchaeota archaeon]|nr:type II toxin-antitoxin system VapC family toxin [Candidatus Woesearchaeota archaeon]